MKKKLAAISAAVLMTVSLCSCDGFKKTVQEQHQVDAPPKMVVMGDSIAAGYGLEGYDSGDLSKCRSYANILSGQYQQKLGGSCGHETVNVAVSGDTSGQLLEHIRSGEFDEALKDSDAVVISIGGNDILGIFLQHLSEIMGDPAEGQKMSLSDLSITAAASALTTMSDEIDEALDGFEVNLKEIITELGKRTDGEIFFQTLYDPIEYYDSIPLLPGMSAEKIGRLDQIIRDNASYGDVQYYTVVDIYPEFEGKNGELTNIKSYDIHPNADGHELIAQILDKSIGTKQYTYVTEKEVTDKDAVKRFVIITGACVLAGTAAVVIVLCRKRKK